ncbi:MAG: insulinase family protein [bacterium]|nr:insulinase family protein [bacterium]MCP5066514.1 insulinase family protein [bacterium]
MSRLHALVSLLASLALGVGCSSLPHFGGSAPHAWDLAPPPVQDRPVVDATRLHRRTLANGLVVIILEDRRLPRLDMGVMVRRGAAIVPASEAGLADFTAELMGRGAGQRDALELASAVDALGASLAVSAGWDTMSAGVGGLSRDRELLFEVLADVVLRPRFDGDEVDRVRAEQLAALEKAREDPKTLAAWNFAAALNPGHPYQWPTSGRPETVEKLGAPQARAFHQRVFVPANAIFYAVGDLDPGALMTQVERAYAGWPSGPVPAPGPEPPDRTGRNIVVVDRPDLGQAQIVVGHPGITRLEPRRIPIQVMNTVLGSAGFSSRLMSKIRAEEGLTYGVFSRFAGRRLRGPFVVGTFTRVPEVGRVIELTLAELERIRSEPPSEQELAAVKSLLVGRFALGLETSSAVLSGLVELDAQGLPADSLDTYRGRIRALQLEQTAAAARDFVRPDDALIVVVGPAETLVPQLEPFGPVRVVQP